MVAVKNFFHHLIPLIGLLLVSQGPVTVYLVHFGVKESVVAGAFSAIGALMAHFSKSTDSKSYTTIEAAHAPFGGPPQVR